MPTITNKSIAYLYMRQYVVEVMFSSYMCVCVCVCLHVCLVGLQLLNELTQKLHSCNGVTS